MAVQLTLPEMRRADAKSLGAFYTDAQVADFLVGWAVREPGDTVMDPSFGGGVFLRSACERLRALGGNPAAQVYGAEVDAAVHLRIADKLADEFRVPGAHLARGDFFSLEAARWPVGVVIGNPPFIRYQRFSGAVRKQALARAAEQGVRLSELASSWAPFLVHSVACLATSGRLAMVLPMEVTHAAYAKPVLGFLASAFREVTFLTFRKKLFPDLSEDTLLLLAEAKGEGPARFVVRDLAHSGELSELQGESRVDAAGAQEMDAAAIAEGRERLIEYLIPRRARELYRELKALPVTRRLGELADVGIGYVTGANGFFHLPPSQVAHWCIPTTYLRRAVLRGRALAGLRFAADDWETVIATGEGGFLLTVPEDGGLPETVRRYLEYGEARGVPQAYKCRTRSPWYRVPHVYLPDAFLSYMSGTTPRLVANEAGAVAPNSLHILRMRPGGALGARDIAVLWQTSLTRLSCEIEGHALGGGMLKIEPTEAENVRVPVCADAARDASLAEDLDALIRSGSESAAQGRADEAILQRELGLSKAECGLLRGAAEMLRERRYSRGSATT